jgi:hypothetical protein
VITRSCFVLASYHDATGTITARFVMSGKIYPARLVGSDPEANLPPQRRLRAHGGVGDGYAVPIDSALQLARQLAGQLCNSHPGAREIRQVQSIRSCKDAAAT